MTAPSNSHPPGQRLDVIVYKDNGVFEYHPSVHSSRVRIWRRIPRSHPPTPSCCGCRGFHNSVYPEGYAQPAAEGG